MSGHEIVELGRVVAVLALVAAAAALATPKGRLPLALRGICRIVRRDRNLPDAPPATGPAPARRRLLAFALVLLAVVLAAG